MPSVPSRVEGTTWLDGCVGAPRVAGVRCRSSDTGAFLPEFAPIPDLIAVVDVGKSHAKLSLTDGSGVVWTTQRANQPVQTGPVRGLGVEAIFAWLCEALAHAPKRGRISHIVPVAHGAAVVLLDAAGGLLCAPDYEDPVFEAVAEEYAAVRDPFACTLSPVAPRGLNVGRQLFYLRRHAPTLFAAVRHIVPYAQYWAWKLSGQIASELTSVGAHTDLWCPLESRFSPMAEREGFAALIPPCRLADEVLGTLRPELAAALGLDPGCLVLCGIHDSNASYLCHRAGRVDPFAVVSSGTWTIVMAHGTDLSRLREARDMLANVDMFGSPVGTARFMGGREYAAIAGEAPAEPTLDGVQRLIDAGAMALPTFALAGPFQGQAGTLVGASELDAQGLASLASLYCALVTDVMLDLLGAQGDLIVDGPFAQNDVFLAVLAALRSRTVLASTARAGTLAGARRLVRGGEPPPALRAVAPAPMDGLDSHRARWRKAAGGSL